MSEAEISADASSQWQHTFRGMDRFDADGREIVYTVEERNVPKGYSASVDGLVITNVHVPEPTPKPTEVSKSTETPKPTEPPKPTESPKPTEPPKPTEAQKPAETPKPTEAPKQTEV